MMGTQKRILKREKYPLLSNKKNQSIDRITKVSKPVFPETLIIDECYISTITCKYHPYSKPGQNGAYIELGMVVKSGLGWAGISVMMAVGEWNQWYKESYGKRWAAFFQRLSEMTPFSFKKIFDSYLYNKSTGLTVFQTGSTETAKEMNNEYYTHGFQKWMETI